ncbi:MAG: hypothetical protein GF364_07590 [Candidatus Lokiarchaeota archaeon]|nr:hypothetical protein [Candidatus Lokiarchaeota archaeon]
MEFCPECDSILLPKKGSDELWCRICQKSFKIKKKSSIKKDYRINHKMKHKISGKTAVFVKKEKAKAISSDDRRAFEDYFSSDGYGS